MYVHTHFNINIYVAVANLTSGYISETVNKRSQHSYRKQFNHYYVYN